MRTSWIDLFRKADKASDAVVGPLFNYAIDTFRNQIARNTNPSAVMRNNRYNLLPNIKASLTNRATFPLTKRRSLLSKGRLRGRIATKYKGRKLTMRKIRHKLNMIPSPAPSLFLDTQQIQLKVPQGCQMYTGLGGIITQGSSVNANVQCSPILTNSMEDVHLLLYALPYANANNLTFIPGQSKYRMLSYRVETNFTNIDNSPVELEQIILRVKQDLPADDTGAFSVANLNKCSFDNLFSYWMSNQYGGCNSSPTAAPPAPTTHSAFNNNLTAPSGGSQVTSLGYTGATGAVASASPQYAGFLVPGVRLTDSSVFNRFFKIVKVKPVVLQPGEAIKFINSSTKSRTYNMANITNSSFGLSQPPVSGLVSSNLKVLALRGQKICVYRIQSIPVSAHGGGQTNVTLGDALLNVVTTYHMRSTYVAQSSYACNYVPTLPNAVTEYGIYPGTSTQNPIVGAI